MIKSMTGYGKAEVELGKGSLSIEIRTLNGKNAEINLRSSLLPKEKELELRNLVADSLVRGTIDIFLSYSSKEEEHGRQLNSELAKSYLHKATEIARESGLKDNAKNRIKLLCTVLRIPDIFTSPKSDSLSLEEWPKVLEGFETCLSQVNEYRSLEGKALYEDVCPRISKILELYDKVESLEKEREEKLRERIINAAEELELKLDRERFEQEMLFYLEKVDISEEKSRLRHHCKFFLDTIDSEAYPGKKLTFIIQEIGREINTTGSKANHAEMQKLVVQMKDELEKIREQVMNIL